MSELHSIPWGAPEAAFATLEGKTFTAVRGMEAGSDQIEIICNDGSVYVLHHMQDCCESVSIESVVGDVADLIGTPILHAEESTSDKHPEGYAASEYEESFTWTFYKLATAKGWVDIRWLGSSNGYYGESVDMVLLVAPTTQGGAA